MLLFFIINDWKFSKQTRPYKTISDLTDKDFLPVIKQQWNLITLTCFSCTLTFNNNSDLRMSRSLVYLPWRRLLLPTHAFQLFLTNHTWAFPRYQTKNWTVVMRRTHDSWSLAFMKSINHGQTWRQKSHEMFARKWLKSSVAATTQLFHVSKSWSAVPVFYYLKCRQKGVDRYIEVVG